MTFTILIYYYDIVKLKELRIKAVQSQEDLAKMAGMSVATVNRLEQGKQQPHFVTIRKLAKALGVEPAEIEFK